MSTDNSNRLGPLRDRRPSSRLAADNNVAQPALSSHRKTIALVRARKAHTAADAPSSALSTPGINSTQEQQNWDDGHSELVAGLLRLLSYLVFTRFAYASYLPYLYDRTVSTVCRTHFGLCRYLDT
jgi:hypothetical protein